MVFLQVRSKRSTLSLGKYKKLSPRYCGPYEIVKKIGSQAYKLKLPAHLKIHDVSHVSLLKPYISNPMHIIDDHQAVMPTQNTMKIQPDCIFETREKVLRNKTIREHLV